MSKQYEKGLVSFCCLSYNHGEFLKHCLESIWGQDYKNVEVIAMDDGSPDGSGDVLVEYAKKSPLPIEVIVQKNTGNVAKNFNILLSKARGEYVSFIAMDDYIEADAVTSKISFLENDKDMVFVGNKLNNKVDKNNKYIVQDEAPIDWTVNHFETSKDLLEIEYKHIGSFYIQGALFRSEYIDNIGGFDDDLLGDDIILRTKLLLHMAKNPRLKCLLLNKSSVNYRMHGDNIHKNKLRQIMLVKEWKDRYFPQRKYPDVFFRWMKGTVGQCVEMLDFDKCSAALAILDNAISYEDPDSRKKIVENMSLFSCTTTNIYLIPFIFELSIVRKRKIKTTQFKIFRKKILEITKNKSKNRKNS